MPAATGEILDGLWRFEAAHPEWSEDEGGEEGWDQSGDALQPLDHALEDGEDLWDGIMACSVERVDEIALWLPAQAALVFADAMLRRAGGQLRVCPDSWTQPEGGPARLRAVLGALTRFPAEHVLVAHGALVLGDGAESLRAVLA